MGCSRSVPIADSLSDHHHPTKTMTPLPSPPPSTLNHQLHSNGIAKRSHRTDLDDI
ncbi:unnamed protein product, partial [Rotaria sp. Silwood2]